MSGIKARVYLLYPAAIPVAIWLVSQVGEMLAKAFPGFVAFAAETGRWTVSFSSAEIVTGALMGLGVIWSVFNKWGTK